MSEALRPCGVRFGRREPVTFVRAGDLAPMPGDLVVVELGGLERLGIVVISTSQLLPSPVTMAAEGSVLRLATATDMVEHGRRVAAERGLPTATQQYLDGRGEAARVRDVYLAPDGGRLTVLLDGTPSEPAALARELSERLQVPVDLMLATGISSESAALSGAYGVGIDPGWTRWLVGPDEPPTVLGELTDLGQPTVTEILDRLFPVAERRIPRSRAPR
jgi:hypothetical protein